LSVWPAAKKDFYCRVTTVM